MQCAPSFFPGPWDAVVVPASLYFSTPALRKGALASEVLVYGPAHVLRAAWMAGARDYLKEPWTPDELYLRMRGPSPATVQWEMGGALCSLTGRHLSREEETVDLSTAEASLLRVLVLRRGTPVSRPILAWAAACTSGRVIDTLVGRIRKKLLVLGVVAPGPASVRGLGYRLP